MANQSWSIPPSAFAGLVEADVNRKMRVIAIQLLTEIVQRSPVDTGRFRNNNAVSIQHPDYSETGFTGGAKLERGSSSGVQAYSIGIGKIGEASHERFPVIYIQNNLPYASSLENGHSGQAPEGVYRLSFESIAQAYK
ncbi:HK97 gp10 family phage protein [Providencia rettgeri]|uniref:HK97 gp10 family phage protein n=1 Tax=Providencia rettgeri TaxID=587 RepID=UPI00384FDFCB